MTRMPELKPQPTPKAVVDEHLDALNRGDWHRLMAQYPDDVEIFLPGGVVIRGREQVERLSPHVDGVIVGAALVEVIERGEDPATFLKGLRP